MPKPRRSRVRRLRVAATLLTILASSATATATTPGPWSRTERREPCASFDVYRQPWFGETHVHTAYSSDSVFAGTRDDPRGAYRFAKGAELGLPPWDAQGRPTRTTQLRRPLDFVAVTDHAEQFGEMQICLTPGLAGYDSPECTAARAQIAAPLPEVPTLLPPLSVIQFLLPYGQPGAKRFSWCGPEGELCLAQASLVWQDTQAAAEQHYDRSSACGFTTFVGYEWSLQPGGNNLHRNVIFRNEIVPDLPTSAMEASDAVRLWNALRDQCLEGRPGCDVLAIPHNPNVSGGIMFAPSNPDGTELTPASAARRSAMEPLVEMSQHKGDSECRPGFGTEDELCGYEKIDRLQLFNPLSSPNQAFPPLNFVRNALKEGLALEQRLGENPFRFGMLGATDDHNATPGNTEERDFGKAGHIGNRDRNAQTILARIAPAGVEGNPGGLAVAWAEENSRDAIFAAMRRREVYGTSGSRPLLRFFGGAEPDLRCGDPRFVEKAYRGGLPMGAEIGPVAGRRSPRFGVLAFRDPGSEGAPGARLQRLQIVKGWVDRDGRSHEKVFDVAGGDDGTTVDTRTCAIPDAGADSLCAVWSDPGFDASERAFYYARLVEEPTCRWSTWVCNDLGIDCSDPSKVPASYAECCRMPKTIQERAWSSPIWYRPEGVASLVAQVSFGVGGGGTTLVQPGGGGSVPQRRRAPGGIPPSGDGDVVSLRLELGAMPPGFDPATDETVVSLRDDDEILRATIPAGTLVRGGSTAELARATLTRRGGAAVLEIRTVAGDFGAADRVDHFVEVEVRFGTHVVQAIPLWRWDGRRLATGA
jgi:hypothetical protein